MTDIVESRKERKLKEVFGDSFLIGAAVNPAMIKQQMDLLLKHFNSITAENEMKFVSLHPEEDVYTFEDADLLAKFARDHGLSMRGHTLVWHNQTSDWLFKNKQGGLVDQSTLYSRIKDHIETVVKRYKSDIYAWDVVNEVISDEEGEMYRPSHWQTIAGPEFINKAFEFAHEADPDAILFYNDYNESDPRKSDKIYKLVKSLVEQGVPIHGVGLQAHWNLYDPSLDDIRRAIEKYASLGLQLQLTELDVSMFEFNDRRTDLLAPTEQMLELQAERYGAMFKILREYRDVISGVTFWGAADDYTWLDNFPVLGRKNWPFLFDKSHQPKPSYWSVIE